MSLASLCFGTQTRCELSVVVILSGEAYAANPGGSTGNSVRNESWSNEQGHRIAPRAPIKKLLRRLLQSKELPGAVSYDSSQACHQDLVCVAAAKQLASMSDLVVLSIQTRN